MRDAIKVRWTPNCEGGIETIELEDLNVDSFEEWDALDANQQRERIIEALDGSGGLVYPYPETWNPK